MKSITRMVLGAVLGLLILSVTVGPGLAADDLPFPDVPRMTKEKLKPMLGNPDVIILDVRLLDQWKEADLKLPGAIFEDASEVDSWLDKYPKDKTLVFYCAWPTEATSARVAQKFMKRGYGKVYALAGGYREWARAQYPLEAKAGTALACIDCHNDVTPRIVSDYKLSTMSKNEVSCSTCHGDHHKTGEDISKVQPFDPKVCGLCHEEKWKQFNAGKHANSWAAMKALPYAHSQTVAVREGMKGCESCHRLGIKSETEIAGLKQEGKGFGLASCNGCHTRHTFAVSEARQPQACQTCHTGSEHAQWEMYSGSKHGVKYLLTQSGRLPETTAAPTCQTCHMPKGNHQVRASWGFYGVRLPLPEDKSWAAARLTVLKTLGLFDPEGNQTPKLDVFKTSDIFRMTNKAWEEARIDTIRTCTECHSTRFSEDELAKGDKMIREADLLLAEAVGIVAGLYADKIIERPKNYAYAFPDTMVRNETPTPVEQRLYVMFMEHRMKAFQGSFHFNPDYALWSGWNELQRDLIEIKSMAEALRQKIR